MAQISINDKTEETELLKEYIIMEKERLDANKKTFQEDKDKYEKYKMDLQNKSQITEQNRVTANRQDEALLAEINSLQKEENSLKSNQHKTEEELEICKAHKKFLDLLAIGAGLKKPRPQRKKKAADDYTDGTGTPAVGSRMSRGQKEGRSTTFMTQPPNVGGPPSKKSLGKKSNDNFGGLSHHDQDAEHLTQYAKDETEQAEKDYERASEIDFDDHYSDDDENIPFKNPKEVIMYLHALEDDNLFKVDNLQTDDETLE